MKKLKLVLHDLQVESFDAGQGDGRGTVVARAYTDYRICGTEPFDDSVNYCSPPPTSVFSCAYTCGNTCSCGCTATQAAWTCNHMEAACTEPFDG